MNGLGMLLAWVYEGCDSGPILAAWGSFAQEIEDVGREMVGGWRALTHWEMCRLTVGQLPWEPLEGTAAAAPAPAPAPNHGSEPKPT